jgi:hypothetical protein
MRLQYRLIVATNKSEPLSIQCMKQAGVFIAHWAVIRSPDGNIAMAHSDDTV